MKIAVFLPNWLGDVAMATPVLRALRRHHGPEARIVGILRSYLREVLGGTDWLSEQWLFDPKAPHPRRRVPADAVEPMGRLALVGRMRRERFDMALLLPNSLSTALVAWLGGARERIGYVRYGRGPLLTGKVYPPRARGHRVDEPMVDYYLRLAEAVGCPGESPRLELATTEADERSADEVWATLGLRTDGRLIALNSSGAYGGSKLWPIEHFAELARRIVDELGHDVLVMCGPGERQIAREIAKRSHRERVFSMADSPLGIGTAKACLRRARLVVSTDSGPRHVAAALGRPVVTLFGPMRPLWSENPTQRAVNLILDLDCVGCHKRTCPLGHHRCMRDLSVDMVLEAVGRLLDSEQSATAA